MSHFETKHKTMESLTLKKFSLSLYCCITVLIIFQTHYVHSFPSINPNQDFVDAHNEARAEVGVGSITWNDTVAAYAQNYANQRINNCQMEHSGGPYGENLAEGYESMTGEEAVKFWVTEKANYDYSSNSCVGDECLHYTQVVWRNSVHLGCARVKCHNDWMFVICSYDPPGNYDGERPY